MSSGLLDHDQPHPLLRLVDVLETQLQADATAPAWTLTPAQLTDLLPRLAQAKNRLDALELALLREADRHQIGDPVGAANTAGWWATTTRTTKQHAHRQIALAARLDDDTHQPTATAMTHGTVSVDQATTILNAIENLPTDLVPPALRRDAEQHLVTLAEHHDPRELRILGQRILDVLAPEISEEHQRQILEREEQHALATATFTMNPDGHGSMTGRFKIPTLAGEMLRKHLDALAAPRHQAATAGFETGAERLPQPTGARVSRPLRLGQAFTEYIETRPSISTPKAGGLPATIVVTMTLENLLGHDRPATLDTGETISASRARRLACEAGIIPAVLGTRSQILDLGRKTRFHTEPQRIALAHRDQGCATEHCDCPPGRCHAHHLQPWSKGGRTSVKDGILLCPRHHTLAHDTRYQLKAGKNGKVTFTRRC